MSIRSYISFFLIFFLFKDDIPIPKLKFEYIVHNRGDIYEGEDGTFFFPYQNIGTAPLILTDVRSNCGCLAPYCKREPTEPNGRDTVYARYDTKRIGPFQKTITVRSNGDIENGMTILRVSGRVLPYKMNEIQVQMTDSLRLVFSEFNTAEVYANGKTEFMLEMTNVSSDTLEVFASSLSQELFYVTEKSFQILPESTKIIQVKRNDKATGWYGTIRFDLSNKKRFSIDVLK
jgi:hypothetical protein